VVNVNYDLPPLLPFLDYDLSPPALPSSPERSKSPEEVEKARATDLCPLMAREPLDVYGIARLQTWMESRGSCEVVNDLVLRNNLPLYYQEEVESMGFKYFLA